VKDCGESEDERERRRREWRCVEVRREGFRGRKRVDEGKLSGGEEERKTVGAWKRWRSWTLGKIWVWVEEKAE